MASGGHGDAAGSQSGVQHIGGSVSSQLDDQRGVNKLAGNKPLGHIWEAVWDKNPMAPPVFLHISADEVVDGVRLASEAIDPTVVLECCPSNRTGVFVPPQFLGNEDLR